MPKRFAPLLSSSVAALAAALVSACGGGESDVQSSTPAGNRSKSALAAAVAAAPLDNSVLFDWAEATYPALFPGHMPNLTQAPYTYRHYPQTGHYVGVAGDDVYVLGPVSQGQLLKVGAREDFRCRVLPQSCGMSYARAGWSAPLSMLAHQVSGRVSVVDERTLRISGFNYDGLGPLVYVYLGRENTAASFTAGRAIGALLERRRYSNETIEVRLPEGQTLDGFGAVSIWCVEFRANFGSGVLAPPAQ